MGRLTKKAVEQVGMFDYSKEPNFSYQDWFRAVYMFNKKRNKFKFDRANEEKMIEEEILEFYDSKDLADMIDATFDLEFVIIGSDLKDFIGGRRTDNKYKPNYFKETYQPYVDKQVEIISGLVDGSKLRKVVDWSRKIIATINDMKGNKLDKNGKVIKGKIPNATDEIRIMLDTLGVNYRL